MLGIVPFTFLFGKHGFCFTYLFLHARLPFLRPAAKNASSCNKGKAVYLNFQSAVLNTTRFSTQDLWNTSPSCWDGGGEGGDAIPSLILSMSKGIV